MRGEGHRASAGRKVRGVVPEGNDSPGLMPELSQQCCYRQQRHFLQRVFTPCPHGHCSQMGRAGCFAASIAAPGLEPGSFFAPPLSPIAKQTWKSRSQKFASALSS